MRRFLLALLLASAFGPSSAGMPARRADVSIPPAGAHPFERGMVSLTFDDGWIGQFTFALPALQSRGWKGTFYLVPGWFGTSLDREPFVSVDEARAIAAAGQDVGSHTMHHPNLSRLHEPRIRQEMEGGRDELARALGLAPQDIVSFATPHGAWNAEVIADAQALFASHRNGKAVLNTADADPYQLGGVLLESDNLGMPGRTLDDIGDLLHRTKQGRFWLILVFHGIVEGPIHRTTDEPLSVFERVLDRVAASGLEVVTVREGVERLRLSTPRKAPTAAP